MNLLKLLVIAALCTFATESQAQKYLGGDISLLPTNEKSNSTYLDKDGKPITSLLDFFKQEKMNAMRVRLFVNPSDFPNNDPNCCQTLEYVKALGKRIKDAGMSLMLDFHYSDTWADPAKQWTPKAWENLNDEQLVQKIYDYTKDVLQQMTEAGAKPDFIQTGNEISYGMLWGSANADANTNTFKKCYPNADAANWDRFINLLKSAGKACREVCPEAKIILHTERTAKPNEQKYFYDKMKSANVDYDIIGLSYYPIWHNTIATLNSAITYLEKDYPDKKIMIVEVGYSYSWVPNEKDYDTSGTYPYTEAGQEKFTKDLITMLNSHKNVNGLFWWWMEYNAYPWETTNMEGWWYAPLFNSNTGKAMPALYEMKNFLDGAAGISAIIKNKTAADKWFTLNGDMIDKPAKTGIYINGNRKVVIK